VGRLISYGANATTPGGLQLIGQENDGGGTLYYLVGQASTGNVGIGVTDPDTRLEVFETVAGAQLKVSYDATRYANFQVDSAGDLIVDAQGGDVRLNDENLFVCAGGSCPAGTPSANGTLVVETALGIGMSTPGSVISEKLNVQGHIYATGVAYATAFHDQGNGTYVLDPANTGNSLIVAGSGGFGTTTPTEQLSVANNIYVGNNAATGLGQATSTFQGDIKILGKLDVGTIDPVYTIDGTKYATYGHSTIGIKEEVVVTLNIGAYNEETGKYERNVAFSELSKGSDLWLFYQITEFGKDWKDLVVTLTPGFDGRVFYEKEPATNTLRIASDKAGEVSVRLIANRFDYKRWPNLRPDQDSDFTHFDISTKPKAQPTSFVETAQ
ncbi:hypothetical protein COU17_02945, partial [Candidatus Kaiserbacteria bacterium CG10_big_fil_rev_8_21_14_0_10_49_17]